MKLLLVHGRDHQGQNPRRLEAVWMGALERGWKAQGLNTPAGLEVSFPFYGDVLDGLVRDADAPLADEAVERGAGGDPEYQHFQREFLRQVQARAGVSDAQVEAELTTEVRERGPENWEWVQALLRALDRNVPELGSGVIETFTRDVYVYMKRVVVRKTVNKIVSDKLDETATVVVGHSLGSVVAYDAMRTDPRGLKVPLYVTVGSPLGVGLIRRQLAPIRFPKPPVERWHNAYDERDVVALFPLDQANFAVTPPVENNNGVRNHTENRHGIHGYLDDRVVSRRIHEALTSRG
jgi:hypothetical protein